MAYLRLESEFDIIPYEQLKLWKQVPTSVASDCMNRTQAVHGDIKSLRSGWRICGQARTVSAMVGDGGAVHAALEEARPGEVIVVSAGGAKNVAVWGGMGHLAAAKHRIGGLVIDGAVRDVSEIRASSLPCFCRGVTPRGPHLQFGGTFGAVTAIGDVSVSQGDLVLGDDDGIVIVPLEWCDEVLKTALEHLKMEDELMAKIESGHTVYDIFEIPKADPLPFFKNKDLFE